MAMAGGIWATVGGAGLGLALGGPLGALAGAVLGLTVDGALAFAGSEPDRARVAFTIAAIALAAKMARADGEATPSEFQTFQRLFQVPDAERANAERFYQLAQGSTAGAEAYARQAAELLGAASPALEDLLDALFLIAVTDGIDEGDLDYLQRVARAMGFDDAAFARVRARHLEPPPDDPYAMLGLPAGAGAADVRQAYRRLVRDLHPDRHMAAGLPPEFIRVAEARLAAVNAAYARLTGRAGAAA